MTSKELDCVIYDFAENITYDKFQPMFFDDSREIHYIWFVCGGREFIYSSTENSYCFSVMNEGIEKILFTGTDFKSGFEKITEELHRNWKGATA